ncbi:unnamed protein product [Albugo candida]|uniref:Uncharacterized protein n=1 Tax=Albugo candida TaxID=65357 RepID=A0A024FX76_9STRA|nr:unnamed protein product [Albugo candida]|eukprot:CCI11477.1 unnamed protein product [Albugo candida]
MLRALAIPFSLICLNAQAPGDSEQHSSPPDANQLLAESLLSAEEFCSQEKNGKDCKRLLLELKEVVQHNAADSESTSQSIEPSCRPEEVHQTISKLRLFDEAIRTALAYLGNQIPSLSTIKKRIPDKETLAVGQLAAAYFVYISWLDIDPAKRSFTFDVATAILCGLFASFAAHNIHTNAMEAAQSHAVKTFRSRPARSTGHTNQD